MTEQEKLISVAEAEIGYLEKAYAYQMDVKTANAGSANYTKFGAWYGLNPAEWCAMFVSWCFQQAGLADIAPVYAGCSAGVEWFDKRGRFRFRDSYTPQPGDVIFFSSVKYPNGGAHTGIVVSCDGQTVTTIEGNTSGASGLVPNGGCVAKKSYPIRYATIYGYGVPLWHDEGKLTQEKFNEMFATMRQEWKDNDAASYSAEARKWAMDAGIVQGGSATAFNGMWEDLLTREQMVTMLYRFAVFIGLEDPQNCDSCKL